MTKATLLIFALTLFTNFCFSQESQESDTNEVTIHQVNNVERDLLDAEIETFFHIAKLRSLVNKGLPLCFRKSTVTRSDNYITLKSGISWETGNPPEQSPFFLFKYLFNRKSEAVQNEIEYLKFANKWSDTGELPYEMINKLNSDVMITNEDTSEFCYVEYKFESDSLGEMKLKNSKMRFNSDSILYANENIKIDSSVERINKSDSIIGYRVNQITDEIIHIYLSENKKGIIYNFQKFEINKNAFINEFIGDFIYTSIWEGEGQHIGGEITKYKFIINNNGLKLMDTLRGGSYSEGAGTSEWIIGKNGAPIGLAFNPDDRWYIGQKNLLFSKGNRDIYLIDYKESDTLLHIRRSIVGKDLRELHYSDSALYFFTSLDGQMYLSSYNLSGRLNWKSKIDTPQEVVFDNDNNLIIQSGYHYIDNAKNTKKYLVTAHDINSGQCIWSFPFGKLYNYGIEENNHLEVSNMFSLGNQLYGITIGKFAGYDRYRNKYLKQNELILFNTKGEIVLIMKLPAERMNFDCNVIGKDKFQLISNFETRTYKINFKEAD